MANENSNISVNFTTDENDTLSIDFPEPYKSIRNFINWAIIGLVLMSIAGNTMIIIVMSRKQNRNSSTSTFFTALAVSDMSLAISVSFERWLHWTCNISLYGISPYLTTAKTILTYSNIQISSWLLLCITVERVLSIAMPLQIREICTKARAGVTLFILCFVITALNTVEFTCIVSVQFDKTFGIIWIRKVDNGETIIAWMDFINSFFIPITVIIVGSVYIVVHLLRISIQKQASKNGRNRSVTMTLLAANIVFVLTMSPFVLLHLIYPSLDGIDVSPYLFWTISELFMFLSDMNAALNFFVYVLSGSRFRSDVKQIFGFQDLNVDSSTISSKRRQLNAVRAVTSLKQHAST
ncbi:FMRFamide receptor-like [Mercenaria mercenaria]|uniref:FMRFamide receptor-like n=1 Tax=Mercenaria mercenaria TaxID=6596 RepID=UPI00234F5200|nr:FMRFamide receptor-like [Mercenaria mercenaria]